MTELDVHMNKIAPISDGVSIDKLEIILLKEKMNKLYSGLEEKISDHFETIKTSIESRKIALIQELKKGLIEKQNFLDSIISGENITNEKENNQMLSVSQQNSELIKLKNIVNNEKLDFLTEKYFSKEDPSIQDLNTLVKSHGKLIKTDHSELIDESKIFSNDQIECSVDGAGLKQCYVNEKSKFTLTFKSRDNGPLPKSNVSFLDIFIVTLGETTSAAKSNFQTSKLTLNDKNNIGTKKRLTTNASNNTTSNRTDTTKRCKCDCTLECIAEGVYTITYKLDKKGIYLLNILVNKSHVGDSPYKLKCLDNSKVPESSRIKRNVKTQSSFNISNNNSGSNIHIPYSATNGDLKKNTTKSKSVSRTNSMSQLSNISNTTRKKSSNTVHNGFNFSTGSAYDLKNSNMTLNKTDDDLLMNNLPPGFLTNETSNSLLSKLNMNSHLNQEDIDPGNFKEDDFLFQIGSRGRNSSEFLNPQAVCATNDFIYISDSNNQKVDVFGHNGEFKFTLGGHLPSTNKLIRRPIGIDSTIDKKILVVDYEFKCVNVFEENGKFVSRMCLGKLLGPKGICVNKHDKNQIIIADSKSNCVCIFDSDGKFLTRFGNLGNKNENFAGPQYVACLSNGDIAITDFYNHCIKLFDYQGQFRFSFGSNGLNQGQFNGPTGITTDRDDNIIVVDWGNSRIQVFNKHGRFIRYINSELNQLYGPQDIALINNTIAVADSGNHCVKIFEYS